MITLTRSEPAKNLHRFYALYLTPNLFGEWVLVAEWGRIGSPGTVRQQPFPTGDLAQAALTSACRSKHGGGIAPDRLCDFGLAWLECRFWVFLCINLHL